MLWRYSKALFMVLGLYFSKCLYFLFIDVFIFCVIDMMAFFLVGIFLNMLLSLHFRFGILFMFYVDIGVIGVDFIYISVDGWLFVVTDLIIFW